jgi:hypothetical protein
LDLSREFDTVVAGGSPDFVVQARASKPVLRIGMDRLSFTVSSSGSGYLYVLVLGPDGSLTLLFPNKRATSNSIQSHQPIVLPRASWTVDTTEPVGIETFLVLVSERPREFGALLKRTAGTFQEFETGQRAAELAKATRSAKHAYVGRPVCGAQPGCEDRYGAAVFRVTVVR